MRASRMPTPGWPEPMKDVARTPLRMPGIPFHLMPKLAASVIRWTSFGCTGVAASQHEPTTANRSVLIARPCDALKVTDPERAPIGIFVEVANVISPMVPPLRDGWSADRVEADQVAGILLELNEPRNAPWRTCLNEACTLEQEGVLTVRIVNLPTNPSEPVSLEVELRAEGALARRAMVRTVNQEPAVAELTPPVETGGVVVTPYYLFEPKQESLQSLMQCKSERHAR